METPTMGTYSTTKYTAKAHSPMLMAHDTRDSSLKVSSMVMDNWYHLMDPSKWVCTIKGIGLDRCSGIRIMETCILVIGKIKKWTGWGYYIKETSSNMGNGKKGSKLGPLMIKKLSNFWKYKLIKIIYKRLQIN